MKTIICRKCGVTFTTFTPTYHCPVCKPDNPILKEKKAREKLRQRGISNGRDADFGAP